MFFRALSTNFYLQNEITMEEIYKIPWYEVPKKDHKNIHIFLGQARIPIQLYRFKVYLINLELFPKVLNYVYSNIVSFRTIQNK